MKDNIKLEIRNAPNFQATCAFLAGMDPFPVLCAGYPRGPYAGNKWAVAIIGESEEDPDGYGDYSKEHKIIVISMKVEGENVTEVAIVTHDSKTPNSLDADYPPGVAPGGNEYIPGDGANPIANAIERAIDGICQAGAGGV